jgi:hypothetical protein
MPRRRFRYDPTTKELVEVSLDPRGDEYHFVRGEISSFRSPIDGSLIDSRTKYEDHCARHNVVPMAETKGLAPARDRYAEERHDQALRERLWEALDRAQQRNPHGREHPRDRPLRPLEE